MAKLTWKLWLLIIILLLSCLSIFGFPPKFLEKGAEIKSVEKNSTAFESGFSSGMIINSVNSQEVKTREDYLRIINSISFQNRTKLIINTNSREFILFTDKAPEITVENIPKTKIKTGLDLSGGARALVKPEIPLSSNEINDLIAVTSNRLNVFGISDVTVKPVSDLAGNNFMLVEVAGATPTDLQELVAQQGKFEAKIGNETVFIGGKKDITFVCRNDASCSGIESCFAVQGGEACRFRFAVYLSEDAADRFAAITKNIPINSSNPGYLNEKIEFYVDDNLLESLDISKDLKGNPSTQHSIQGSGTGATRQDAINSAQASMKKLQTILITGSLPYKLEIVKLDSISPVLGKEFTKNLVFLALVVFLAVSIVLFIKYRKIKITLSVILTMFSEAFITLAIAALINWNLDAPSIAGIIAGMGTGVDDQIVIIDESVSNTSISLKERIKRAFFVIIAAFFLTVVAMLPLFWAGAGLLRGFTLTTIIGVSVGILITRPAFADIIRKIQE